MGRRTLARVEDQLCFALYAASRALIAAYRPMLARVGLTYPQYLVMLALWERDGRSVADLGEVLQLESNTVSPMLRKLESMDLITKRRSTLDERVVHVHLTSTGVALEARLRPVRTAVEAATGLNTEQFEDLRSRLHALREAVTESRLAS
jgi:DNA-binding MarR family transcriptional regulator